MKQIYTILLLMSLSISTSFCQSLVINEFSSLNSKIIDENNDTPDWIEIYNPTEISINLRGWSLTDDSTILGKWMFPTIDLFPKEVLFLFASGKDRKEMAFYHNLVNWGDEFSYAIGSADIPSNWKSTAFDDSAWEKGISGFGYGDNDDATSIPLNTISVFVRKEFTISQISNLKSLLLHMDYDDGFVAFVNGTEVARVNLGTPNTTVLYNQLAENYVEPLIINGLTPELFDITAFKSLLTEGENVLCIQVHNNAASSSDLSLIPFLTVGYSAPVENSFIPEILNLSNRSMHTNFKIGADGEDILLVSSKGIVDRTDSIALPMDVSYGRKPDGNGNWYFFGEPTPGKLNTTQAFDSISKQEVNFIPLGGIFTSATQVSLASNTNDTIYFTTDGSEPTRNSSIYKSPIAISSSKTIRAKTFSNSSLNIQPSIQSYIISSRDFKIPVMSLSTDPVNLWDHNYGIYADGPNWTSDFPHFGANFWMDWERPIFIEYFDAEGNKVFSSPAGVKIFGAWSRGNAQKSFSLFAREAYGASSFKYPFFKERNLSSYKSLVLRNSGNDWAVSGFRDPMHSGLLTQFDIERQAYQPVVVYINGEYWGILNLREKVNEDFLASHHGIDPDKVDILEINNLVVEGESTHYLDMLAYLGSHNIVQTETYEYLKTQMEVLNFMDYEIAQIYINNTDWPGNNIKYWRPQTSDGRWRWIIYDTDFGFGTWNTQDYSHNMLAFALATNGPGWPNPPWSTYLLRTLVKNSSFKAEFINRFADKLNDDFLPGRVTHHIDSLKSNVANEMPYHIAKWNHIYNWDNNVANLKTFANYRPNYMRNYINSQFTLGGVVNLTVDVSDAEQGYVQVSSLRIKKYPWSGKYFKNNPVKVVAMAKPGYEFSHWEGIDSINASFNASIPTSGLSVKAIFKASIKEYNDVVINEISYKSVDSHDCGDWVELFNTTNTQIDLSGWIFKDSDNTHQFIMPQGTTLAPKGFMVLSEELEKFKIIYPAVSNAIGSFNFGLSAAEEALRLYDAQGNLIDSVLYMSDEPWPALSDENSETLSLIDPYKNNEPYYRWEISANSGTPGYQNDNYNDIPETLVTETVISRCYPNPFRNEAFVHWKCQVPVNVKIEILDYKGTLLDVLFEGDCPTGAFESSWENGNKMAPGLYLVKITTQRQLTEVLKWVKN